MPRAGLDRRAGTVPREADVGLGQIEAADRQVELPHIAAGNVESAIDALEPVDRTVEIGRPERHAGSAQFGARFEPPAGSRERTDRRGHHVTCRTNATDAPTPILDAKGGDVVGLG